jgi:putative photosynthetic complex assembly protein
VSEAIADRPFPRGVLAGVGTLLLLTLGLAFFSHTTGIGKTVNPSSTPAQQISIRFEDRSDGAVAIYRADAATTEPIGVLDPGTNGFVRGVVRGLVRERRANGIGSAPSFELTRWRDGRLSLVDPATGRSIELDAFGPTNAGVFAGLLAAGTTP